MAKGPRTTGNIRPEHKDAAERAYERANGNIQCAGKSKTKLKMYLIEQLAKKRIIVNPKKATYADVRKIAAKNHIEIDSKKFPDEVKDAVKCTLPSLPGGTVCGYHGGHAPQTKQAAKERIVGLLIPALDRLKTIVKSSKQHGAVVSAIKYVGELNGLNEPQKPEISLTIDPGKLRLLESMCNEEELVVFIGVLRKLEQIKLIPDGGRTHDTEAEEVGAGQVAS